MLFSPSQFSPITGRETTPLSPNPNTHAEAAEIAESVKSRKLMNWVDDSKVKQNVDASFYCHSPKVVALNGHCEESRYTGKAIS